MTTVEIVVPAYNEGKFLEENILYLYNFLKKENPSFEWKIIIGENGSKDNTLEIAKKLSKEHKEIEWISNDIPNRDLILKKAWENTKADIVMYNDADMSTNLKHIQELISAIQRGYDIAIGSRLKKESKVKREKIRIALSLVYNKVLLPIILPIGVNDAQCGFKAINQKTCKEIVPLLSRDNITKYSGFLDTELLAVAHSKKFKVKEIPIEWEDKRESTMSVWKNVPLYLRNIFKTRYKIIKGYYK